MSRETKIENRENIASEMRRPEAKRVPLAPDEPLTLGELFRRAVEKHPLEDALNYKKNGGWTAISSAEMLSRMEHIALGLGALGLGKNDKIAILAANSPEWTLTDGACQLAGVVDVPIYTTSAVSAVHYIVNDSGAKVFFLQNLQTFERLENLEKECPGVEKLVFFDATGVEAANAMSLAELETLGAKLKNDQPQMLPDIARTIDADDIATLIYTSGTTGEPKGVMLSHANILANVIDAGEKFRFAAHDVPLSVLPLSHVFERSAMYLYILNGMSVHYAESVDKVADNLREVRPTIFVGVPRIFEKVYAKARLQAGQSGKLSEKVFDWAIEIAKEYAVRREKREKISFLFGVKYSVADKLVFSKFREFFGGRLRSCITGGAALSDDIYLIFNGAGVSIMQGYGLTETSPVITSNNPIDFKLGTVGKPIRSVQIRIAADGEIEVFGPSVMRGYYKKEQATREAFTADGWFKTGDIGEIDADGFLKITDRKKELFKTSGGKYVAPSPIEQLIVSSRFVSQAVLVGDGKKFPAALIVPNFEQIESEARREKLKTGSPAEMCADPQIVALVQTQVDRALKDLAQFEKVKKIALIPEELTVEGGEMTPTLKIKRRVINEKYRTVIENIYAE